MNHGKPSEKYSFMHLLIVYSFTPDIETMILGNHIARKKTKKFWLSDMNFIFKN